MQTSERQRWILDALGASGRVEVPDLAERLEVSTVTVRRDLDQLAVVGALRRVRGGAVTSSLRGEGLPFGLRAADGEGLKARLAAAAVGLIADGEAVVVDSGTTGAAAATALASRRVTVMPLSVQGLVAVANSASAKVLVPGGAVRQGEGTFTGPMTETAIASLRFDTAIMTCCAVSLPAGVMAYEVEEAAVKRAVHRASARTVLIAEAEKFARTSLAVVCLLTDIDVLVTDPTLPATIRGRLQEAGVEVVTCSDVTER